MSTLEAVLHPGRAIRASSLGRNVSLVLLLLILLFLTAYPMAMLVYGSLSTAPPGEPGAWSVAGWRAMLSRANALVLANTVVLSLVKTALSMGLALLLAWIVARTDTPARGTLEARMTPEMRSFAQTKLPGTTDPKLQEEMLKLAKEIYG
jgi:iron(III) transport system permease protein